jgi:hypothetical protein
MSATFTWALRMKLNGVWTDVSSDVRHVAPKSFDRGIDGNGATDRVAKPGSLSFAMDNSATNSGGLLGYYSVDNANCRPGFGVGTEVFLEYCNVFDTLDDEDSAAITDEDNNILGVDAGHGKFFGKISDVTPLFGEYKERYVSVMCVDYMNEFLVHNMKKVAVQTNKTSDQLIATIVGNLPTPPRATSYAVGPDTFAYALHDIQDERTSGMAAVQRVDQSGLSYTFISGDTTGGETLTHQSRNTRYALSSVATFNNSMTGLIVNRKADGVYNYVKATGYPVKLGVSAEVLWTQQKELIIGSNQTMVVEGAIPTPRARAGAWRCRRARKSRLSPIQIIRCPVQPAGAPTRMQS